MFTKKYTQPIVRYFILLIMLVSIETKAQLDSIGDLKVTLNGYLETYYLYDFANPGDHLRPAFYVSHHRHNEFNLNMGIMRFSAENKKVKGFRSEKKKRSNRIRSIIKKIIRRS